MDKKLIILVLLFFLVLAGFTAQIFYQSRLRQARAASKTPSEQQSIMLAFSDGKTCTVSPVVRADDQSGVKAEVCIKTTLGDISSECGQTDDSGIVKFTITSAQPGTGEISARVNNSFDITTKVTCQFN